MVWAHYAGADSDLLLPCANSAHTATKKLSCKCGAIIMHLIPLQRSVSGGLKLAVKYRSRSLSVNIIKVVVIMVIIVTVVVRISFKNITIVHYAIKASVCPSIRVQIHLSQSEAAHQTDFNCIALLIRHRSCRLAIVNNCLEECLQRNC